MNLLSIRIITSDVERLVGFYETVTGLAATRYTPDFAEITTAAATLAIGATRTLEPFGGAGVAQAAANRSAIIEFRVHDVDAHYLRLGPTLGDRVVQGPTTMPWGNRSLLFRDPDGNLVNLFQPVTADAIRRFEGR